MKRFTIPLILALLGLLIAVVAVIRSRPSAVTPMAAEHAVQPPFASFVAGVGITESGRGNVSVGTSVLGIVSELFVAVGDPVTTGTPLFKIDDRDLQAKLSVAGAKLVEAEANLAKPMHRFEFLTHLQKADSSAVSKAAISDVRDDVKTAQAALGLAKAETRQIEIDIERSLIRAPAPGRVLQINTRVGEYVEGGGQGKPLILLGDDERLYLRTDVDENDAWRIKPQARARALVRGNPQLKAELRFEYIEPYVAPKTSLTGQSTERPDVRVLQVIYSFKRSALPVYLGQQMDVFIEAPPVAPSGSSEQR